MNVSIMGTCYDIRFVDEYPERLKGVGEYADGCLIDVIEKFIF